MTDRMPDLEAFEAQLAARLQAFAAIPVADVDELAIARETISAHRPGWFERWLTPLPRALSPAVLLGLLLLGLLAAALTVGGLIDRLRDDLPAPQTFPFVEELGPATTAQLSDVGAIRLQDGRVLIVGGADTTVGQQTVTGTWFFDPATEQVTDTGVALNISRAAPLLALLPDGRVLVFGGYSDVGDGSQVAVAPEIFDPASRTSSFPANEAIARLNSPFGAMDHAWASPQLTALADGRVLITGGSGGAAGARTADLFDPATDAFAQLEIGCDATRGTSVRLLDDLVLVTCLPGGGSESHAAVLFDAARDAFTPTGTPSTRGNDNPTLLPDGRVLLTGSSVPTDGGADLFDPATGTFSTVPVSAMPDGAVGGIDIGGGRFLFVGDIDPVMEMPSRVFDAATLEMAPIDVPTLRLGEPVVRLADGRLLQIHYQLAASLIDPSQLP